MSRAIKFRIWDIENKVFLENEVMWSVAKVPQEMTPGNPPWVPFITLALHSPKYVVQQFTGLSDKNGKEMYEGDFVRYQRRGGVMADNSVYISCVGYDNKEGGVYTLRFHDQSILINNWNYLFHTFEVIGNIFQNPELLTK